MAKRSNKPKEPLPDTEKVKTLQIPKSSSHFHEILVIKSDFELLREFERMMRFSIPQVSNFTPHSMGYVVQNTRIIALSLHIGRLTFLPECICQLTALKQLSLACQLIELPDSFINLTDLTELYLGYNRFNFLPETLCALKSLTVLNLTECGLRRLPECIGSFPALKTLSLYRNEFQRLPESIGNLSALCTLDLRYNPLTILPDSFGNLKALTQLELPNEHAKMIFPPPEICSKGVANILQYLQDMQGVIPSIVQKVPHNLPLTEKERTYPLLWKWRQHLENLCWKYPESSTSHELMQLFQVHDLKMSKISPTPTKNAYNGKNSKESINLPPYKEGTGDYHGTLLPISEYDVLMELEALLGSAIPKLTQLNDSQFGYVTSEDNSRVNALGIGYRKLTMLPANIGQLIALQKLYLLDNRLSSLPDSIGDLQSLQILDVRGNQLFYLPHNICKLHSLQFLALQDNQFTALPEDLFQLKALQTLFIGGNLFTEVPECVLKLTSLQQLDLGNNVLKSLPNEFGCFDSLQYFAIENSLLTTLPKEFARFTSLHTLSIWRNQFTSLPKCIYALSNLKTLLAGSNRIETLPDTISHLTALEHLYLSRNQLRSLPNSIGRLGALKMLYIDDNHITSLPDTIGQLSALEELNLEKNKLDNLPESIGELRSLQKLRLGQNNLTVLPESMGRLIALKELFLHQNQILTLPQSLGNLTSLYCLWLPDSLRYPPSNIPKREAQTVIAYLRQMQELLPRLLEKIAQNQQLTNEERNYPFLLKWGPQLEECCFKYPDSATGKDILRLLKERGFISVETGQADKKIWL